ncbi:MAG: phosphoribosyltransferase [Endomicrobium sp.]|jgi:amidophosphoribosyltransferase|nr:phosphoribosyltransferase [Endomicrobium sp.]
MKKTKCPGFCVIDLIYRKSLKEQFLGIYVWEFRAMLSKSLAEFISNHIINKIDGVVACPNTGTYYGEVLAKSIGKPCFSWITALNAERYLSVENSEQRKKLIYNKLAISDKDHIKNKSIILIDEAIFTGTTLEYLYKMLKENNVKEIYICIPTPKYYGGVCKFGYATKESIFNGSKKQPASSIFNDLFFTEKIIFQQEKIFLKIIREIFHEDICSDCFIDQNQDKE